MRNELNILLDKKRNFRCGFIYKLPHMSINDFILTCLAPFLENLNKEELCFLMVDFNIDLMKMDSTYLFIYLFIYLLICSLLKIDLHLAYKKPINDNKNTANISANKLSNNNDNNKT